MTSNNKLKEEKEIQESIDKVVTVQPDEYYSLLTNLQDYFNWEEGEPTQQEALANKKEELIRALNELKEKILLGNDWSTTALLVIDMQEGFRKQAEKMKVITPLQKAIKICHNTTILIINFRF